ncbi:uncharacterized protein LOC113277327 [Papaver somniferum]|nr:uncharacterized protein LOC113277327 [Papaver somniferum]
MNLLHQIKQETQVELETPPGFKTRLFGLKNCQSYAGLQENIVVQPKLEKGVKLDLGKVDRNETTGCSEENINEAVTKPNGNGQDFGARAKTNTTIYEYPDPEFFDFEMDKREECFAVGQLWSVYDDFDGMPRLYARIDKVGLFVYSQTQKASLPSFKVYITWLDASPDCVDDIVWNKKGLPIACGKFKHGAAGTLDDIGVFSHQVVWRKGNTSKTCIIYPRKGETWALFKNWNINWSSDPNNHRNFDYEYVEVLSDYNEQSGIHVAYLVKNKGFVSLFKPSGVASFYIPPSELLRFSHKVPSFETSGMERDDVPEGYYELDPASLPANHVGVSDSLTVKSQAEKMTGVPKKRKQPDKNTLGGGNARSGTWLTTKCNMKKLREQKLGNCVEQSLSRSDGVKHKTGSLVPQIPFSHSLMDDWEVPDTEFYYFDIDKSHDRFQAGQIWALYCELDGLPKYYAQITKVELLPEFKLNVRWLEACTPPMGVLQWHDKKIPICTGVFSSGETAEFDDTASFSHLSVGAVCEKENKYEIYPREGEVWAIYKKFSLKWSSDDLQTCQYDIGEVVERKGATIKVLVLEKVSGFETVFKGKPGCELVLEIPDSQLLRFSHQIPAFQLTDERDGKLQGCWELDPKAMPVCLFHL